MVRFKQWIMAAVGSAMLAGCATAPEPRQVASPAVIEAPKPNYRWTANVPAEGEAKVVIDLMGQLMYVYRGEQLVGVSTISSGKKGKETQLGFWSVRIKKRKGFSRKYDNAPMPFMQMYDPKGLAFHAGALPGYPASHGCVRLPLKFAERLFGLTKVGTKVVIEG